jgi:hypothetical protein
MPLLDTLAAKETFEAELERVRAWYGCYITGYVVMPEHVHLLLGEPERSKLSVTIQMLKQITSRNLRPKHLPHFWRVLLLRFSGMDRSETHREAALHTSQSGKERTGDEARGLEMEQLCSLRNGDGRDCRNRIAMDRAETRTNGSCAPGQSPPSRQERGKGGATP